MDLRSLITVQCLKVNLRSANLDAGAGRNQSALRRGDLLARMLITRTRPVVRPIRQSLGRRGRKPRTAPSGPGMPLVIPHEKANDQIGIDEPSLVHRIPLRRRAAFAAPRI